MWLAGHGKALVFAVISLGGDLNERLNIKFAFNECEHGHEIFMCPAQDRI